MTAFVSLTIIHSSHYITITIDIYSTYHHFLIIPSYYILNVCSSETKYASKRLQWTTFLVCYAFTLPFSSPFQLYSGFIPISYFYFYYFVVSSEQFSSLHFLSSFHSAFFFLLLSTRLNVLVLSNVYTSHLFLVSFVLNMFQSVPIFF